jgi:hypothetical protein
MTTSKKWILGAAALMTLSGLGVTLRAGDAAFPAVGAYRVYCANGKIEVDSRSLEQIKKARGANVCQLAEFGSLSEAESYAEGKGGKGGPCACR